MSRTPLKLKPILKWAGGKRQLLPVLASRYPPVIGEYHEPFVGSAAVYFDLQRRRRIGGRRWLTDGNPALINLYRWVRDEPEALIRALTALGEGHEPDRPAYYYEQRQRYNEAAPGSVLRAALLVYLNRTCFNGLYRVNRHGHFNVPMGSYRNPTICDPGALRMASRALAGAELACADFRAVARQPLTQDAFVYFDPPYHPLSPTSDFTSYTRAAFGEGEQRELARLVDALTARGVRVMLSNSWTPLIRELYAGYRLESVTARRAINRNRAGRGPILEALVTNYDARGQVMRD